MFICYIWLHNIATVATIASLVAQLVKEPAHQCRRHKRCRFDSWVGKIPGRRKWQPIPEFLPGESHGQRSLVSCSPWGRKESDTAECTHTHAQLSFLEILWKWLWHTQVTVSMGILIPWCLSRMHNFKLASFPLPCLGLVLIHLSGYRSAQACGYSMFSDTADCRSEGKHFHPTVIK